MTFKTRIRVSPNTARKIPYFDRLNIIGLVGLANGETGLICRPYFQGEVAKVKVQK